MIAGENIAQAPFLMARPILTDNELISGGVIHIWIDGTDVGSIYTFISNAPGAVSTYDLPLDMDYGAHAGTAKFFGGFTWVNQWVELLNLILPACRKYSQFNVTQTSQLLSQLPRRGR